MELEVGVRVHTGPVEPGDLVASAHELYRVEAVLRTPPGGRCVPVLTRASIAERTM